MPAATPPTKAQLRAMLLAARRAVPETMRRSEARQLSAHLADAVGDLCGGARSVCAYLPVGSEPGSPELLDRLRESCDEVLLPVIAGGDDHPLSWGRYVPGTLVTARFGLQEPPGPWLPPEAIRQVGLVLVPALAVDRAGVRLGRGGGFYDRSLPLCAPGTPLVAVVRDDELVDELPHEPHDVLMTHALTPGAGLIRLGECHPADGGSST
ncbi:MAG: 5-formyltetrahydrofolate cyclo-ligase [Mycobacterium sp.]